jgi:exosortase
VPTPDTTTMPTASPDAAVPIGPDLSPVAIVRAMHANGWTIWHGVALAVLIPIGVLLTRDGWADLLWLAFNDEESSHVMIIPLVLAWVFWVRRHRLAQVTPRFSLLAPLLLLLGWGAYEYMYYEAMRASGHIAAIAVLAGLTLAVAGSRFFWRFLPVFGVLLFAIPVPHRIRMPISVPLQRITANATESLLQFFGVAIERHGSILTINGVDVGVAEACNGMRMVFAVFLVTYLFVFITPLRPSVRVLLLLLCPLLAIACNIIRLVPTVFIFGYASADIAETFHDLSGWVMIGVAFLLLMGVVNLIRWMLAEDEEPQPPRPAPTVQHAGGK